MAGNMQELRQLSISFFELAKQWWNASLWFKILTVILSLIVILFGQIPQLAPFIAAILSITSELLAWRSDKIKRTADSLLGKLDLADSFGWELSGKEVSDLLVQTPKSIKSNLNSHELQSTYFASRETIGAQRAIENIQESAWWSKHLARRVGLVYLIVASIIVFISIALLIISIETIKDFNQLSNMGRAITSVIVFIFSVGFFRIAENYYDFSQNAERAEVCALHLLSSKVDEAHAIKLVYEYQLIRSATPLLPTWIWKLMQKELNLLWKDYRQNNEGEEEDAQT